MFNAAEKHCAPCSGGLRYVGRWPGPCTRDKHPTRRLWLPGTAILQAAFAVGMEGVSGGLKLAADARVYVLAHNLLYIYFIIAISNPAFLCSSVIHRVTAAFRLPDFPNPCSCPALPRVALPSRRLRPRAKWRRTQSQRDELTPSRGGGCCPVYRPLARIRGEQQVRYFPPLGTLKIACFSADYPDTDTCTLIRCLPVEGQGYQGGSRPRPVMD